MSCFREIWKQGFYSIYTTSFVGVFLVDRRRTEAAVSGPVQNVRGSVPISHRSALAGTTRGGIVKKIVWRNSRFVIFEADHTGHFEARLIEALTVVGPENPFGNAAW